MLLASAVWKMKFRFSIISHRGQERKLQSRFFNHKAAVRRVNAVIKRKRGAPICAQGLVRLTDGGGVCDGMGVSECVGVEAYVGLTVAVGVDMSVAMGL